MPRPPPPQSAFTITGYPIEWQKAVASSRDDTAPLVAGVTGTPRAMALALALDSVAVVVVVVNGRGWEWVGTGRR
jgi:hypothetical protein